MTEKLSNVGYDSFSRLGGRFKGDFDWPASYHHPQLAPQVTQASPRSAQIPAELPN